MGREATTVTLLEGIMVRLARPPPGLTLLLTVLAPPPITGLLVVTKVGLWLVGTDGILEILDEILRSGL